jgi:quinol monooxygenase YgiN
MEERRRRDMLTFRLHTEFTPQTCDEAAAVLRSLVGPVRSEPGCSATRLLSDTEDGCGLTWVEEWRSVEDFERHLRATAFRQILAVIELAAGPPLVEIDDVTSRRGFELVEEILGLTPPVSAEYETG